LISDAPLIPFKLFIFEDARIVQNAANAVLEYAASTRDFRGKLKSRPVVLRSGGKRRMGSLRAKVLHTHLGSLLN